MENFPQHLWVGLAGGLVAFVHCLGMCGGFVLHLSQEKNRQRMVTAQLLWQVGKLATYTFLGALAGYAGGFLEIVLSNCIPFQNLLSYLAGAVMLLAGLSLLGLLPVRSKGSGGAGKNALAALSRKVFSASSPGAALTMGIATGFLPCPIILAFLAYSLQSRSVATGMATMSGLGLGTMLPLLLLGGATRLARLHLRSWGPMAGGIILVLLGLTTALRGTAIYHQLLGCPTKPALHQQENNHVKPCCTGRAHGIDN